MAKILRREKERAPFAGISLVGAFARDRITGPPNSAKGPLPRDIPATVFRSSSVALQRIRTGSSAKLPSLDLPEVGSIIGKFRLEKLLGVGAFAAVYRGTHLTLGMSVALKFLRVSRKQQGQGGAVLSKLQEEARLAARINHPNVVRILDIVDAGELSYIVMEYVDGQPLSDKLRSGPLGPSHILTLGRDITHGLEAGEEHQLVHRDVKPANILVEKRGIAKLVDYGLATLSGVSQSGAFVGTPAYMAPEQATSRPVDFHADLYALGCTLFEAATGRLPFSGRDSKEVIARKQRAAAPPDPRETARALPAAVASLIMQFLERVPEARGESLPAVIEQFEELLLAMPTTGKKVGA
jgi:eukaryotic-like serine/threonine-protein kinase